MPDPIAALRQFFNSGGKVPETKSTGPSHDERAEILALAKAQEALQPTTVSVSTPQMLDALRIGSVISPAITPLAIGASGGDAAAVMTPQQRDSIAKLAQAQSMSLATGPATPLMMARAIPPSPPPSPPVSPPVPPVAPEAMPKTLFPHGYPYPVPIGPSAGTSAPGVFPEEIEKKK